MEHIVCTGHIPAGGRLQVFLEDEGRWASRVLQAALVTVFLKKKKKRISH